MRFFHVFFFVCCLVSSLCFSPGYFTCTVAALEDATVSSEEVDISDPGSFEGSESDVNPLYGDVSSDVDSVTQFSFGSDADYTGLAYIDISSSLGNIRLYLPYGVDLGSISVSDGCVYNLSSSTLYFYCPDFPDYTFSASRFSPLYYRASGSSMSSVELTSVSLIDSRDSYSIIFQYVQLFFLVIISMCLIRWWFK